MRPSSSTSPAPTARTAASTSADAPTSSPAKAVVDWLNGRGRAYDARSGGKAATAGWTDGATGMIGKSWDATIANGVAATGVKGLKTIVPISGISSWYDYYFAKGAPLYDSGPDALADVVESPDARARCAAVQQKLADGAPRTGDWTGLWTERDYVPDAGRVRASVFMVHGMQDLNVRTQHAGQWWDALARHGVERKVWLSQTGHVDPFDHRRAEWVATLHQWFDHYLMGYDNGIDRAPAADIERAPGTWSTDPRWPAPGTATTTLRPAKGSAPGVGALGTERAPQGATETFTDDPKLGENDWAAADRCLHPRQGRVRTGKLTAPLRLSGSGKVTVTATPSTSTAHLSAVLVDLGPDTIRNYGAEGEGITTLDRSTCWGAGTAGDTGCFKETAADTAKVTQTVFSRGSADLGNYADAHQGRPLTPGKPYTITLDLGASDHIVPGRTPPRADHRRHRRRADRPALLEAAAHPRSVPHLRRTAADRRRAGLRPGHGPGRRGRRRSGGTAGRDRPAQVPDRLPRGAARARPPAPPVPPPSPVTTREAPVKRSRSLALGALAVALTATLGATLPAAPAADARGSQAPRTGFEKSHGARWTGQPEERDFLAAVDQASPRVRIDRVGVTKQGRPLHLVRIGARHPARPATYAAATPSC